MNKKNSLKLLFILLGSVLLFHFFILFQLIPYELVWAGKLNSVEEMRRFESFSIALNTFILIVLAIKHNLIQKGKDHKVVNLFIWLFAAFFALNTIGNLFAKSTIELIFGTLLTFSLSVLCFLVVRREKA